MTITKDVSARLVVAAETTTGPAGPHWGLEKFRDPLRIPPMIHANRRGRPDHITITTRRTRLRLHSQLPVTDVWAYEGSSPGPTIEVRRGQRVTIDWVNGIHGTIPLVGVAAPNKPQGEEQVTEVPGYRDGGVLRPGHVVIEDLKHLEAWNVVHLHGSMTNGWNDGWAPHAIGPGHTQRTEYPNEQHSTALWYHDHAMDVTRFNVHAGLNGMFVIRDEEEARLRLPHGRREIPLVIRDCNLDTDSSGRLTGQLLFKIRQAGVAPIPFSGPFNTVNGVIWPHLDVDPRWYRFRVLNTANSRFYTLKLVDEEGRDLSDAVHLIGTDGGLLPRPVPMPPGGIPIAPSERLDVLIDFRALRGRRVRLTNAGVPVSGRIEPDLMEFRVGNAACRDRFELPRRLARSYVRLEHGTTVPHDHDHLFVALAPPGTAGEAHPQLWDLVEIDEPPQEPTTKIVQLTDPGTGKVRTFRVGASTFHDTTNFFVDHGRWVVWNFVHLGGPAHPMHIHMSEFQMLNRRNLQTDANGVVGWDTALGGTTTPLPIPGPGAPIADWEQGWKDTFVVNRNEWVSVAAEFTGATGEFMYHCHILDHEDEGMMRPFAVRPPDVAAFDGHAGGHGHKGG